MSDLEARMAKYVQKNFPEDGVAGQKRPVAWGVDSTAKRQVCVLICCATMPAMLCWHACSCTRVTLRACFSQLTMSSTHC